MKLNLIFVILLAVVCPVFADHFFECDFENPPYILGSIYDQEQGDYFWDQKYIDGYDDAGNVVDTQAYSGTQSLDMHGRKSNFLSFINNKTTSTWLEFAFKPDFVGDDPEDIVWFRTLRGYKGDIEGIKMTLVYEDQKILIFDTNYGLVQVGTFTNGQWHTIAFRHYLSDDGTVYSGVLDVYLNGVYVATITAGSAYNGLQTILFSTAEVTWTHYGRWYIDDIRVTETPLFAGEPRDCSSFNIEFLDADVSGPDGVKDCYVDIYDLDFFATLWLEGV